MKKIIVNIVSLGHSGSTLIGNILDCHSKGIHIGEIPSPIRKGYPVLCRNCLNNNCHIWGNILNEKLILKVYNNFNQRNKGKFDINKWISFIKNYTGLIYKELFKHYPELRFIVDSSKDLRWYNYNYLPNKFSYKYIFLKRDLKAVYASEKRKNNNKSLDEILKGYYNKITKLNSYYHSIPKKDKISIDYELFCHRPGEFLKAISELINIDYEEKMLNFQNKPHHLIGGNTKLLFYNHSNIDKLKKILDINPKDTNYYQNLEGIKLDERWKHELTKQEISHIDEFNKKSTFSF